MAIKLETSIKSSLLRNGGLKRHVESVECKQNWRAECLKWVGGFVHAGGGRMVSGVRESEDDASSARI